MTADGGGTPAEQHARGAESLVAGFLTDLAAGRLDAAADALATDVEYTNVSLPTIRGRERVRRIAHSTLGREAVSFEAYVLASAVEVPGEAGLGAGVAQGSGAAAPAPEVVLNERIDVLSVGRLRVQFWVFGHFEVRDGVITVWRDAFDWANLLGAFARGVAGIAVPGLRPAPPQRGS